MVGANVIPERIGQALSAFPPFSMLPAESVVELAGQAKVRAVVAGARLFEQGDAPIKDALFLERGRVEYFWTNEGSLERVDVRDVGDLIGLTSILEAVPMRVRAEAVEDCLFYVLPGERLKELIEGNDAARHYARRHLFWATRVGGKVAPPEEVRIQEKKTILQSHLDGAQAVRPRPPGSLLTCLPGTSIRAAAAMMAARRVPTILVVNEQRFPVGLVTSAHLVREVIVGDGSVEAPVRTVMETPVHTVSPQSSSTAAILLMLRERVGLVCVTEDGTADSPALDVCTHKDLLAQSGNHPAGLMREIREAQSVNRLRELCDEAERIARSYLEAGVSGVFLGQIFAELYDALTRRALEMASLEASQRGDAEIDFPWAWMSVGSDGRREQVLRTDMDNAIAFVGTGSLEEDEARRRRLLPLAERVVGLLVECGFARCQGGVMASNPRWCRTEDEWRQEISTGASGDGESLLRATILLDLRHVAGDKRVCQRLRRAIFDSAAADPLLMRRLAEMAVETPPPLNFWGKFVVEKKGSNLGDFDIKARGLAPLRDAARALALRYGLFARYSTGGRFEELGTKVEEHRELARLAYEAYDFLLRLRTSTALHRGDSGRFIAPASLTKLERAQLSNVFDVLRMAQLALRFAFRLESRAR